MIDAPTPFAPLSEWEAFRREMLKLDQEDGTVKYSLAQADAAIARRRAEPD
ncbi:hypothetical protein [Pelagibius marinus]|uniref:hypothetical protein n=1 Tax=Pelagibius marinus TaxID=2762760 RepID=UPI001872D12B|nr:hypothetical protein [Pelagibius marinus]